MLRRLELPLGIRLHNLCAYSTMRAHIQAYSLEYVRAQTNKPAHGSASMSTIVPVPVSRSCAAMPACCCTTACGQGRRTHTSLPDMFPANMTAISVHMAKRGKPASRRGRHWHTIRNRSHPTQVKGYGINHPVTPKHPSTTLTTHPPPPHVHRAYADGLFKVHLFDSNPLEL